MESTGKSRGFWWWITVIFAVIGVMAIIGMMVTAMIVLMSTVPERVPAKTILELDLERGVAEYLPDDPVSSVFLRGTPTLRNITDGLKRAENDDRVVGLVAKLGSGPLGFAQAQEIRDAVISFRNSGKPAIAFAETFAEVGNGTVHYYLATAFDEIYLQPSGDLGLIGFSAAQPFVKNMLEKIGIETQLDHRYEYKTAMYMLTEEHLNEPHREATGRVIKSIFNQMVRGIAEARGKTDDEVIALIDKGPFLSNEALEAGFIDGLAYRDEAYERGKEQMEEEGKFLFVNRYLERAGRPHKRGETIALIYGVGSVHRGESSFDPIFLEQSMGSETVARAIRKAIDDKQVKAIIFRIDSPGGSYVASDAIWREVNRAREKGKPVVATMGNVAGSGGYFVAMGADKIVAQPATITGSIGVVYGKFVMREMWEKLGITWDAVKVGENADMWDALNEFTPEQWERLQHFLDRIYEDFTRKAADGRNMTWEEIHEVAKGRIWSGEDALELGLVDEVGGYETAIRLARELAGIDPDEDIRIRVYPEPRTFLQMVLEEGRENSYPPAYVGAYVDIMKELQPILRGARNAGLFGNDGEIRLQEFEIR